MSLFKKKDKERVDVGVVEHVMDVEKDKPADPLDSLWARAEYYQDDRYLRQLMQVRNWRMFAFFMLIVATLAVAGNIYIGSKSKFIPVLVEVDKLGRTVAVRAVTGEDAVADTNRLVYREMFDLIESLRTVTTDVGANGVNLNRGFSRLVNAATNYARTELKKAPPNEVGTTKTVQIQVKTAMPISDRYWQIEWEEHSFGLDGIEIGVEKWKATLRYELRPSGDEKDIRTNPIGFTVVELNWMKVI